MREWEGSCFLELFSDSLVARSILMESRIAVSFFCILPELLHGNGTQGRERLME
jgi:hypothetical protein